ncbi:MAG: hypothetical protein JRN16_06275 [Nitrososphaerota archaeon]|nr:hypothetical protein [Nitrososphaerota archaeon]MDG7027997.1 hypothetical protein [Nitrososphaerota archaeon]
MKHPDGRLYPKAARTGPYSYGTEVNRVNGMVVSKRVGIVKVPEDASVVEEGDAVESGGGADVL